MLLLHAQHPHAKTRDHLELLQKDAMDVFQVEEIQAAYAF